MASNLYLIGFMGTGKTAVGKLAADHLGLSFIDSDVEIERKSGKTISAIFDQLGEEAFRLMEKDFILDGHPSHGCLVSCGGGLPIPAGLLDLLKERGRVVALWASPESIYQRTKEDSARPLLQVDDPLGKITDLLAAREPVYRNAHEIISTEKRSPQAVCELLTRYYEEGLLPADT